MREALIIPGYMNSGPDHWQSHWEALLANARRAEMPSWDRPVCDEWVTALEHEMQKASGPVLLVGHSLGTLAVVHWASRYRHESAERVAGALLVAPADPGNPNFPSILSTFDRLPLHELPFRSIVVASENDPFVSLAQARVFSTAWGSDFINIGPRGHINAESNLGTWGAGLELLHALEGRGE